jgi:fatty-acyl-CoA synthase
MKATDLAFILYTSGTTGKPKGAMLSHHNIIKNASDAADILCVTVNDNFLVPVPFSHCFGNVLGITMSSSRAAGLIPLPIFTPEGALELVQELSASVILGVPTMFIRQLETLRSKRFDTSSLRTGIMAGAPCPVEVVKAVKSDMNCDICIAYGLTEASPLITFTSFEDPPQIRAETVGRPIPDVEVRIVDDGHAEVPLNQTGELCCRGYNVMQGYYKDPEGTERAIDHEGWLYSGDLATMDEKRYVRIVGRKKDMVIVGGVNIYPREVEEYLHEHPKVQDVQVVGVPDPDLGEVAAAAVMVSEGEELTEQDVVDHCYGTIASPKVPRYVKFVKEYPMSGRGKVQKFRLREELKKEVESGALIKVAPSKVKR